MLRQVMSVQELGVFLLQKGTVHQNQFGNVPRRLRCVDAAPKTVPDEPGQVSGMVEMSVRQDDRVDCPG